MAYNRRRLNVSEQSEESQSSQYLTTFSEAASRANELVESLNNSLMQEEPLVRLRRHLSTTSIISTASTLAREQLEASYDRELQTFRQIGRGYCGVVFAQNGTNLVFKKALTPTSGNLVNDALFQTRMFEQFGLAEKLFPDYVPRVPRCDALWRANDPKFWADGGLGAAFPEEYREHQTDVLVSERILPIPKPLREALIDVFCPSAGRNLAKSSPANKDCIIRLYLGRRRSAPVTEGPPRRLAFFSLKNFPLHLNQAEQIGVDVHRLAREMAMGLAICHWRVHTDANDVEFVLGSAPTMDSFKNLSAAHFEYLLQKGGSVSAEARYHNFQKREVHLWLLDFDKAKKLPLTEAGMKQAAAAAEDNDPYFPKPLSDNPSDKSLWTSFATEYLACSKKILDADNRTTEVHDLPTKFIHFWETYRQHKLIMKENSALE